MCNAGPWSLILVLALASPPAHAEAERSEPIALEDLVGPVVAVRGPMLGIALGYRPSSALAGVASPGWAWGHRDTSVFGETVVLHLNGLVGATTRVDSPRRAQVLLGLEGGILFRGPITRGLAIGLVGETGDDRESVGPALSARIGWGRWTLRSQGWVGLVGDAYIAGLVGLEMLLAP